MILSSQDHIQILFFSKKQWILHKLWQHNRGNYTTPTIYQKKKKITKSKAIERETNHFFFQHPSPGTSLPLSSPPPPPPPSWTPTPYVIFRAKDVPPLPHNVAASALGCIFALTQAVSMRFIGDKTGRLTWHLCHHSHSVVPLMKHTIKPATHAAST